jgi:hypothetical protein
VHPLIRSILPLSVTNIEPLISVSQNKTLGAFVQYGFLRLYPLLCSFPTIHIPISFRHQLVHFQGYAESAGRLNDSWCLSSNPPAAHPRGLVTEQFLLLFTFPSQIHSEQGDSQARGILIRRIFSNCLLELLYILALCLILPQGIS